MNILNVHVNVNAGTPGKVRLITVYATITKISSLPPNNAPWETSTEAPTVVLDILNRCYLVVVRLAAGLVPR